MTVFPFAIDSDTTIQRVDDNITDIGGDVINQARAAIFSLESNVGIEANGSANSIADRLNVSLNPDGSIKASALTTIGLASLPIINAQVANNAGIQEFKLSLDYSTSDLHTTIVANAALLNNLVSFTNSIFSDFNLHLAGAKLLADGTTSARHVLSQIDLNVVPSDSRDPSYTWPGLIDKNGIKRTATQAAQGIQQINDDLVAHENSTANAHLASAISVDTSTFSEIPNSATSAQLVFDYLDEAEVLNIGLHRAVQHSNGIPKKARSQALALSDGYGSGNVVPPTSVTTYLIHSPNTGPVDDLSTGDNIIRFNPNNTNFVFDSQFSQVKIGDILRVNYGNGIQTSFPVESIRYIPGVEWVTRINGTNLFEIQDGYASARIDKPLFDTNTVGVLAVASANASGSSGPASFSNILSSIIVGNPQGATAFGLGFDPGQLNSTHYQLYLELYPTGNPLDHIISLPAIDVTGNLGATPGGYTLDNIVSNINNNFREIGYNYRLIAFASAGEIGIMLADAINNVSFAIIKGNNSSGTMVTGIYTNNVIGGNSLDDFDALGFGSLGSNLASPAYQSTWTDATAAQFPTNIILPVKNRNYYVNGQRKNAFASTYLANSDGYWDGYISARNPVGSFTVEVTYTINLDLAPSGLKAGKTIVIQPSVSFSDSLYSDVDYGRFIIKNVTFNTPCGSVLGSTTITVINGIHASGSGFGFSSAVGLPVRLYFGEDSVSFSSEEVIDQSPTTLQYARLHEIYIDSNGHTFSHERARLPRQTEDVNKLNTFNFHIKNVSPKLRGYQGVSPIIFNKLIRLFVLDYDPTSGSYDGYLGQISGTNSIISVGPITTARKNVTTRFYDETGIDFIDLSFEEVSVSPGVNILSTASPRYVDIELFPSLELDDENLFLATCEVNWQPASNQYIIQYVHDARQFGSISETDFTNSALNFISAGDSLLHENGVLRGLGLDFIGNNGEVFFKGGLALVNGKIATINNMSVTIPQISNVTSGLPQNLQWAVCVNQNNDLIPILLTNTEIQFFATPGSGSYYVQSVTLAELINTRKDLTPIALVAVTINSLTINSVLDIRRFITSSGLNNYLTWTSDNKTVGHFSTLSAVQNWVNNYNVGNAYIIVKGIFNISSSLDFTGFTQTVIFDGPGAVFNVTTPRGLLLNSNLSFKNITFNYNPVGLTYGNNSFAVYPNIINSGNGCIYGLPGVNYNNNIIENCIFNCALGTARPPFINIEMSGGTNISNLVIRGCNFTDVTASGKMAAIALIGLDNTTSIPDAVINCKIQNNICNQDQGIYITSISNPITTSNVMVTPGVNIISSIISDNNCGTIGYTNSSFNNNNAALLVNNNNSGLSISRNTCRYIATVDHTGVSTFLFVSGPNFGTSNVIINDNFCNWIHVVAQDQTANNQNSSLIITDNVLNDYNFTGYLLTTFLNNVGTDLNFGVKLNAAIIVYSSSATTAGATVYQVCNNSINSGVYGGVSYSYDTGIFVVSSCNIAGNIIKGLASGANAIKFTNFSSVFRNYWIDNNKIYRNNVSINSYINGSIGF